MSNRRVLIFFIKSGLHEPQLPVERSVTLVSSIVVERRCCALKRTGDSPAKRGKQ